jgi:hypothetical protein
MPQILCSTPGQLYRLVSAWCCPQRKQDIILLPQCARSMVSPCQPLQLTFCL